MRASRDACVCNVYPPVQSIASKWHFFTHAHGIYASVIEIFSRSVHFRGFVTNLLSDFNANFISIMVYSSFSLLVFDKIDLVPHAVQSTREHREAISATMVLVSMASMRPVCMDRSIHFARAAIVKINSMIKRIHCMEERT